MKGMWDENCTEIDEMKSVFPSSGDGLTQQVYSTKGRFKLN